jgi:hypothetical protein
MSGNGFGFRGKADFGHGFWNSSGVQAQRSDVIVAKGKVYYGAQPPDWMVEFEKISTHCRQYTRDALGANPSYKNSQSRGNLVRNDGRGL